MKGTENLTISSRERSGRTKRSNGLKNLLSGTAEALYTHGYGKQVNLARLATRHSLSEATFYNYFESTGKAALTVLDATFEENFKLMKVDSPTLRDASKVFLNTIRMYPGISQAIVEEQVRTGITSGGLLPLTSKLIGGIVSNEIESGITRTDYSSGELVNTVISFLTAVALNPYAQEQFEILRQGMNT